MTEQVTPLRNISNSEVTAFLSCKVMYNFAFIDNITPKVTPDPLARGGLGHNALEEYWKARMRGADHTEALRVAHKYFGATFHLYETSIAMQTRMIFDRLMGMVGGWPQWEPLGTEERHDLLLNETLSIAMRYDFYLREKKTGKRRILDWKYTYDFWQPWAHELNPQMPLYVAVLQANGFEVDGGILYQIRTRDLGPEKAADAKYVYKATPYNPTFQMKQSILRRHIGAALEIEKHRALDPEERERVSIPVLNQHGVCKFCNFKDLCKTKLEGKKDLSVDIRHGYTQNTYGYNQQLENAAMTL